MCNNKPFNLINRVTTLLREKDISVSELLRTVTLLLPSGWQYPEITEALIAYGDMKFVTPNFSASPRMLTAKFESAGRPGSIQVAYAEERPARDEGPFLVAERQLINHVAELLRLYLEARATKEALFLSEWNLGLLKDNIPAIIFTGYTDWSIDVYDNKIEEITGYPREGFESRRMKWCDIMFKEDVDDARMVFVRALKARKTYVREYRIHRQNGEVKWMQERASIVCDQSGKVAYVCGIFFDISDRRQAEEELDQYRKHLEELIAERSTALMAINRELQEANDKLLEIDRMKNEFISTVSHELRTPLTSIRGSLGLITGGVAGEVPIKARELVEIAYKNSERLVNLINDILDIEKIESGRMDFRNKEIYLTHVLAQALEANSAYASQFGVRFELDNKAPLAMVVADGDRLMQVFTNLLSNAAKFSPTGGTVTISVSRHDTSTAGMVRVAVTDRGPGIPHEFYDRIFGKFAQADSSAARLKGGTGLGLSISKVIVERLGGRIGFHSEPNVRTTFYFDLPELRAIVPEAPGLSMRGDESRIRPRILVCEDDKDIAALLRMMLNQGGFDADIAYNADQAKQMLSQNCYSAMTVDLLLPDQYGIALIRELREDESTRGLPIIVVSANAGKGRSELDGDAFMIIDWIDKPINRERLVSALNHAVTVPGDRKPRILHVEDDLDVCQVVSYILQDLADIVSTASIGDAQAELEKESFDLVLLDISLPDGSGMELLPTINRSAGRPIPVIVFSAHELKKEMLENFSAALIKSRTSNEELLETIKSLLKLDD